jgi:quercetin dioxygenase-like cupin family protein
MGFHDPKSREVKKQQAGVQTRTFWGEKLLFSLLELEAGAVIASHSHPHEQGTYVISGGLEATVGEETHWVSPGELFIVPGGVEHSLRVGKEATRAIGVFTPLREDLQY